MDAMSAAPDSQSPSAIETKPTATRTVCANSAAANVVGEVRCPVCYHLIPPEQIGYKLHCRRCGYLESCCNPI
jgi:hypothetical protein